MYFDNQLNGLDGKRKKRKVAPEVVEEIKIPYTGVNPVFVNKDNSNIYSAAKPYLPAGIKPPETALVTPTFTLPDKSSETVAPVNNTQNYLKWALYALGGYGVFKFISDRKGT